VALEASAYLQVHPSFTEPQFILPYNQASGAFDSLPDSKVEVRLGTGDLLVYAKRIDVRTQVAAGQAAFNELPSCSIFASQLSTATYLQRVNAQYDHHDTAAADQWGFSIVDAYRHAMWQGHNQFMRNALLYGYNPVNGEGLMNGSGSTATSLPADSNGNTTISTYDNGQLAFYFLQLILGIKTRTYQLGVGREFTIVGPQRDIGQMSYPGIVQLVQYQRAGAGSATTAGLVKDITADNGDTIKWVYDDTLIGKGAGGTDAILIVMPKVEVVEMGGGVPNTNIFAQLMPSMGDCTKMYCDMVAPREIPTPVPYGGINVLSEIRVTSGWPVRPEAVTILSAAYS
jgi:hypothetical protein